MYNKYLNQYIKKTRMETNQRLTSALKDDGDDGGTCLCQLHLPLDDLLHPNPTSDWLMRH